MRRTAMVLLALVLAGCEADTDVASSQAATTTTAAPATTAAVKSTVLSTTPAVTEGPLGTTFNVNPGDRKITAFTFRNAVESDNRFTTPKAGMRFAAAEVQEWVARGLRAIRRG